MEARAHHRDFLVVQWLRIHLPMQGTWVQSLVWEDPTCPRATKPLCHNYWSPHSRACEPQLLKSECLEPVVCTAVRSPCTAMKSTPSLCNKRKPVPVFSNKDPAQPKINLEKQLIIVCMEDWQELMPPRVWSPTVIEKWPSFQIKIWFLLFFLLLFPCYLLHSFPRSTLTKFRRLGVSNYRNIFSNSFGAWKSKTKVLSGLMFSGASLLGCLRPPSHCVFTWFFLGTPTFLVSLLVLYKDIHHIGFESHPNGFILVHLFKHLISNAVSFWGTGDWEFNIKIWGGRTQFSP